MAPKSKKAAVTKQQLAADQLVIDADEEQLQQKLINKQQKQAAVKQAKNTSNTNSNNNTNNATGGGKSKISLPALSMTNNNNASSMVNQDTSNNNQANNTNGISTPQSPAVCKVCEQHVYQMERVLAEKSVYHKKCFRCQQCNIQLRVDNYSTHEGQLYCKIHHRQLNQPQAKLNNDDDVDIVAKSRLRQRQMIICENQPAELPKDVVRSDTKIDDGIEQLNLNLKDLAKRFEEGAANNSSGEDSQPSSAGVIVEKPLISIKKTLMAFENRSDGSSEAESKRVTERPVVRKLTNLNGFLERQNSQESGDSSANVSSNKPLAVRRSESLMLRLKKYESRIAGEQVQDEDSDADNENDDVNNNNVSTIRMNGNSRSTATENHVPKKLTSIDLSSLKSQWENGDINKRRLDENDDEQNGSSNNNNETSDSINCNGNSPQLEKSEELHRIRQQLARKKLGESGNVRNIYENAIKEAQQQQQEAKRNSSDLSSLVSRFSTTEIQKQLLQNGNSTNGSQTTASNKDHFQLSLSKRANKLKEKFELGLINNDSRDDSDASDCDDGPVMSKLEQIRQEKMEDLSIFTEGEIKAREARSMFQQIDRRLSAAGSGVAKPNQLTNGRSSRTPSIDGANNNLSNGIAASKTNNSNNLQQANNNHIPQRHNNIHDNDSTNNITNGQSAGTLENQPIRLTNNVKV